jgi:DNA polymerase elongation subunit (family B)
MQCRLVPDSYQGICATGNGEKWNSILISEYLARGKGIPERQIPQPYVGGLVECHETGIIHNIVKADVESLYPSLMLTRNIKPAPDTENILLPLLYQLKDERMIAKRNMQAERDPKKKEYWDGYQQSAKILINSAYGFMGSPAHFGDWKAAEAVTLGGREVVARIRDEITARGGRVVEVDTDGVMFVPPDQVQDQEAEEEFVEMVGSVLPEGIVLAHDGRFEAILSLRMKNYVLLGYDGKMKMKGSSLKSRATEKFCKEFLRDAITMCFADNLSGVVDLYHGLLADIYHNRLPVDAITRRERITEKTHTSSAKARLSTAAPDAAVGEFIFVYEKADGRIGLVEEYANDPNTLYYMRKLHSFFARLSSLWGDWQMSFPKPGKRNMHSLVGEPDPPKSAKLPTGTPRVARSRKTSRRVCDQGSVGDARSIYENLGPIPCEIASRCWSFDECAA